MKKQETETLGLFTWDSNTRISCEFCGILESSHQKVFLEIL